MWCARDHNFYFYIKTVVFVPIFLINKSFGTSTFQTCFADSTYILNNVTEITWLSQDINNEIITSLPPCTDDNNRLVVRVCTNASWIPDFFQGCTKVTKKRRCPINFEETSKTCLFISSPKPWGHICSFESPTEPSANVSKENEFIWVPYKRSIKYGPFEAVSLGDDRSKQFKKPINASLADTDFFNKNCLIANALSNEFFPEFCDKNHRHLCEFDKSEANSRCPNNCVSTDIVSQTCHCKQQQSCPTRLSKIQTIFDLTVLKDLADDDICYVDSDLPANFNMQQGLSKNAWFYTDKPLRCSLCTTQIIKPVSKQNAEMVLNFDEKNNELFLTIYSPESLLNKAHEKTIYCYTDANKYEIKKRMKADIIVHNTKVARPYNVYEIELEKYIGTYWCEAFKDINDENIVVSNKILAWEEKPGTEFSLRLTIENICTLFSCSTETTIKYEEILWKTKLVDQQSIVRVMDIFKFDFDLNSMDLLLHVTNRNRNSVIEDYYKIKSHLKTLSNIKVTYLKSSEFCLPDYAYNLSWPLTPIGQEVVPDELCLQKNGLPVVRFCGGNFLNGGEWYDMIGECEKGIEVSASTKYLQSLLNTTISEDTVANVTSVIKSEPNLPVLSVYMVSKFLDDVYYQLNTSQFDAINCTSEIADNLLNVNKDSLINAQELLNVTDALLDLVDNILISTTTTLNVLLVQKNNLIIHITNPLLSNISGLVLYENNTIGNLVRNSTFENIGSDALLAMVVPEEIITYKNTSNLTIITTIYFQDKFFESNYTKKPSGPVISITIPELGYYLPSTIPILFKGSNNADVPECGFWDYGKNNGRKKGRWSTVGGDYLGEFQNKSYYHICSYSHLTHFSLLRMILPANFSETDDDIMDIIFYVGDVFSVLSIAGIFLTAVMFKKWRKKQGTVILLNLSVAILLEGFTMQITDTQLAIAPQGCTVLGMILHYIVISKFCWMLVYSFLQYMRFVKVLTVLPENIVLKSIIFGWGFAVIPVGILNIITSNAYTQKRHNFCYPTGIYLYLGTVLPVGIIICINTFVFFTVMREVTSKKVESHGNKHNIHKLQIQLAILLFFVLGVPWLFYVFANLIPIGWIQLTLAYLFCLTSNFQGFILFLFYVVFNSETRKAWLGYFNLKKPLSFSVSTKTSSKS